MTEPSVGNDWDEVYDREDDVYYVNFNTGEPSYCVEVDDVLVVEVGLFSGLPTGYRILNKSKIPMQKLSNTEIRERMSKVLRSLPVPTMSDREAAVAKSLEKVLA
jgi:hypothetical protein